MSGFHGAVGIPRHLDAIGLEAVEKVVAKEKERFISASRDLDTTLSSFRYCILFAIEEQLVTDILGASSGAEMADIEQREKIVHLITCEFLFSQHVCELVFGVNVTDLDLGVLIDSIEEPMQSNSVFVRS